MLADKQQKTSSEKQEEEPKTCADIQNKFLFLFGKPSYMRSITTTKSADKSQPLWVTDGRTTDQEDQYSCHTRWNLNGIPEMICNQKARGKGPA